MTGTRILQANLTIPFSEAPLTGREVEVVRTALSAGKLSGDGQYGRKCEEHFSRTLGAARTFLTASCTQSLEMAGMLLNIQPGDEVIMSSFTFVSTANAFALRGAQIVFIDIRPDTMNLDERHIEAAITPRTRAIVPVHYAGVACEMDFILEIAEEYELVVIEDAAHGVGATYKDRPLGAIGDIGTFSFHESKTLTSGGEGGLTIIRDPDLVAKAQIIREKGTDRSRFMRGEVDKYTWVELGSSYLLNEISAAYLWAQVQAAEEILSARRALAHRYQAALANLVAKERIELQDIPEYAGSNGQIFYIKVRDLKERTHLLKFLKDKGINAAFHYAPLHSSLGGRAHSRFSGVDKFTTRESERLLRFPAFYGMTSEQQDTVIAAVEDFF